jgi:predicted amidohydrolase
MINAAHSDGAELVFLQEYRTCLGVQGSIFLVGAAPEKNHAALIFMIKLAKETGIWILNGSMAVTTTCGKIVNRSMMINDKGNIVVYYDKIHLFDVNLKTVKHTANQKQFSLIIVPLLQTLHGEV